MAAATTWADADTQRAEQLWAEFVAHNDVSALVGQAAGVDPASGRIWIGESALDVVKQMKNEGVSVPLYFIRVGFPTYLRKGARR